MSKRPALRSGATFRDGTRSSSKSPTRPSRRWRPCSTCCAPSTRG